MLVDQLVKDAKNVAIVSNGVSSAIKKALVPFLGSAKTLLSPGFQLN